MRKTVDVGIYFMVELLKKPFVWYLLSLVIQPHKYILKTIISIYYFIWFTTNTLNILVVAPPDNTLFLQPEERLRKRYIRERRETKSRERKRHSRNWKKGRENFGEIGQHIIIISHSKVGIIIIDQALKLVI